MEDIPKGPTSARRQLILSRWKHDWCIQYFNRLGKLSVDLVCGRFLTIGFQTILVFVSLSRFRKISPTYHGVSMLWLRDRSSTWTAFDTMPGWWNKMVDSHCLNPSSKYFMLITLLTTCHCFAGWPWYSITKHQAEFRIVSITTRMRFSHIPCTTRTEE